MKGASVGMFAQMMLVATDTLDQISVWIKMSDKSTFALALDPWIRHRKWLIEVLTDFCAVSRMINS